MNDSAAPQPPVTRQDVASESATPPGASRADPEPGASPAGTQPGASPAGTQRGASPSDVSATPSQVRELVTALDGVENRPVAEHADRYAAVHAGLQSALMSLDDAAG